MYANLVVLNAFRRYADSFKGTSYRVCFLYFTYLHLFWSLLTLFTHFRRRGLNTFSLRPHCGEAGHVNHLVAGYLTSESIAHGLMLRKVCLSSAVFVLM